MPIATITKSLYPAVPEVAGVPALLRSAARLADTFTLGYLGIGNALDSVIGQDPLKWAVLDPSGNLFADYDSVLVFTYQNTARVSDYPIEEGQFASYNKTDDPYDVTVTLTCGGSDARRAAFQASCENARKSLLGYTVITPETTFENVNFVGIRTSRTSQEGATLLTVEMTGREIRDTASASFSQPQSSSGFDLENLGAIQTVDDPSFNAAGIA